MKNSLKISAMLVLLFFAATTVSNAQRHLRDNQRMTYAGQCLDIPGLSDDQKSQITEINTAHREKINQMREQFYAAEDVISANEIKAKMALEQNAHLEKISKVLNAEQKEYFNENIITGQSGRGNRTFSRAPRGGRNYRSDAPGRGRGHQAYSGRGRGPGKGWRY